MQMTQEMHDEMLNMLRLELARQEQEKKENRTAFQTAIKDFEDELSKFDWTDTSYIVTCDKRVVFNDNCRYVSWKIRDALGTLLKSAYKVDAVRKLPADKIPEMRSFIAGVLAQMRAIRKDDGNEVLQRIR